MPEAPIEEATAKHSNAVWQEEEREEYEKKRAPYMMPGYYDGKGAAVVPYGYPYGYPQVWMAHQLRKIRKLIRNSSLETFFRHFHIGSNKVPCHKSHAITFPEAKIGLDRFLNGSRKARINSKRPNLLSESRF